MKLETGHCAKCPKRDICTAQCARVELLLVADYGSKWRETIEVQSWNEYNVELWEIKPDEIQFWYELKQCLDYLVSIQVISGRNADIYHKLHCGETPTGKRQGQVPFTFERIAELHGISISRAAQVEKQVKRTLRKHKTVLIKQLKLIEST